MQSDDQLRLLGECFPHAAAAQQINSFVEPAEAAPGGGEAFLWVSRLAAYKRSLLYADLAAAVPQAQFWMVASWSADAGHEEALAELRRRAAELPTSSCSTSGRTTSCRR